jgi:manganese transport protein
MWIVSEAAAMATDLAEFLGGAIGLSLMLHMPLPTGMAVTGVLVYALLGLQRFGFRPIELAVGGLVAAIGISYLVELLIAPVDWRAAAWHAVLPRLEGAQALVLAVGIIGATVMPHALYLHSGLTQARIVPRSDAESRRLVRASNTEVAAALGLAGFVNMAMVLMAASAFYPGHSDVGEIAEAYRSLKPLLGAAAASAFLIALMASGVSSSVVGTMAGQMIMQGFVGFRIALWVRRLVTMLPAVIVVAYGVDPTQALVLSQVVLSAALPFPMIALVWVTGRADIMGRFVNRRATQMAAIGGTAVVLLLNLFLIVESVAA